MKPSGPVKAYENMRFLRSADGRMVRMLCEYQEPLSRFHRQDIRDTIVVFGSARARPGDEVRRDLERERRETRTRRSPERIRDLERQTELARYYDECMEFTRLITEWAKKLGPGHRFVICSGGGPGIMEAANRGATERAKGRSVGLTISLPREERPNPYITPDLCFEFHYFFMRKLWFAYMAAALVVFPGGFGTMDELFEMLTLTQTRKIQRPLPIVLYGRKYWEQLIDFQAMVRWGTIAEDDLRLFHYCDTPRECFEHVRSQVTRHYRNPTGAIRNRDVR